MNGEVGSMSSEELLARAAHLYYVLGLTQKEVADRLGVPRIKAHRILAMARQRGIVRIHIDAPSSSRLALEADLAKAYGLSLVSVVPSDQSEEVSLSEAVGQCAAPIIAPLIKDEMTVAVSWGLTLKAMANVIEPASHVGLNIVPLIGSLSRSSSINRYEAVTVLAQRLGAECYYMPTPIFCDSVEARQAIGSQPIVADVIKAAVNADLAIVSIGGDNSSSVRAAGNLEEADFRSVKAAGAIGNYLGHFIDRNGDLVDHEINRRVVGVTPEASLGIPNRIMVAGGPTKVEALRICLHRNWITGLITDENTAAALVSQ